MIRLPSFKTKQKRIDDFNKACPIGTPVVVTKDDGTVVETVTMSAAKLLSGHTAVVWVDNMAGCYRLDRVRKK